jgi:Na+-translocating ferredoxin:NAD+ oxidoreductase subunit G
MFKSVKIGLILGGFCLLAAWGLSYVYLFTMPQIEANKRIALEQSKKEVLPADGSGEAIVVKPRGYSSEIEMMVGIDPQGKVSGVKILSQKETPGLGADVAKPGFLDQFKGKSVKDKLAAKQDIDAITGATISSRAVCKGVKDALARSQSGNN